MNELYIDIHSLFCRIDHYRVLSRVPCAIQFFSYMLCCFSCVQLSANPRTVASLLCPWDSPGKNTGVGCHFRLLSVLCIVVCTCQCQSPKVSFSPVSSGNHKFAASDFHFVNKPLSTSPPPQILCISNI